MGGGGWLTTFFLLSISRRLKCIKAYIFHNTKAQNITHEYDTEAWSRKTEFNYMYMYNKTQLTDMTQVTGLQFCRVTDRAAFWPA